ncbi:MAG: Re/Si-specific NAD(P)(+) transhydrogenase subunit alpha [Alphaproteobacteria bacterium]
MKIGVPKERRPHERRVAATPDSVKRLVGMGAEVLVETGAGAGSNIPDDAFVAAGAKIAPDEAAALRDADIVLKVQRPLTAAEGGPDEVALLKKGAILVGLLSPHADRALLDAYAKAGIVAFSMEFTPRITRAQAMDALSSQSNLAGYKAVIDAAAEFGRAFPMMMTAAGTIAPARVVILGAGVAGLQAIATARRLGAVVSAFDVRAAAKEQVESLGASFVEVSAEDAKAAETAGGYAKEMSEDYKRKQAQVLRDHLKKQDVVITTALIPGKPAPRLIDASMVAEMKPGAVIVDLAVEAGGNCELSEFGKIVVKHGVTIVGHANVPSRVATDASALYSRNLWSFLSLLIDAKEKALKIDWEDEIVKGMLIARDGIVVHPTLGGGGK